MGSEVVAGRDQHTPDFKSRMLLEVLILNRQNRIVKYFGKILIPRDDATLKGKRPKFTALVVIEHRVGDWAIVAEFLNLRKINRINQPQSSQGTYAG